MKHKHAELIKAWADGAEIEFHCPTRGWLQFSPDNWHPDDDFRIKPESQTAEQQTGYSRLEWAEDLIKQLPETHDGRNSWLLNYGSKPEPKPDVEKYFADNLDQVIPTSKRAVLKIVWDESERFIKSAEVLK